jgi:hypothetical protein
MPCPCRSPAMPLRKRLLKATTQCGMGAAGERPWWHVWINIGRLSTACGWPAEVRLLPATTRTFTKAFNQNAVAFSDVFNLFWWWWRQQILQNYTFLLINLKVKASLSSVVMLRLHHAFFFCLWATMFQVFKFRNTHSKIFEKICPSFFRCPNWTWNSPSSSLARDTLWVQYFRSGAQLRGGGWLQPSTPPEAPKQ